MKTLTRLASLAAAALLLAAGPPAAKVNWLAKVARTPQNSHLVGNPDAKVKLVEYFSYTCPHCADFEVQASGELALGFIRPGTGSIEYRPYLRSPIDTAATLLAFCGGPARFPGNHAALMRAQAKWFVIPSRAQESRWQVGNFAAQMRAIASDEHLYTLFEGRGYRRIELDRCLADKPLADAIADENQTADRVGAVDGTPTFFVNDRQQDTNTWAGLRPILQRLTK